MLVLVLVLVLVLETARGTASNPKAGAAHGITPTSHANRAEFEHECEYECEYEYEYEYEYEKMCRSPTTE